MVAFLTKIEDMYYSRVGEEGNGIPRPGADLPDNSADMSSEVADLSGEAEERARLIDEIRGLEE